MAATSPLELIFRRYRDTHGAEVTPAYTQILQISRDCVIRAAVGYRRADEQPLFLERYLVQSIEMHLSAALRRPVGREDIIEIGNLAADDAFAMISLWGMAANDLGGQCEIAVATLTAPLRRMFTRLGVALHVLGPARAEQADEHAAWGRYYDSDPQVCAGLIAQGQEAIARFLARRERIAA